MNILITAAGTSTAFGYVLAIAKNFNEINLITADINEEELITSSLFSSVHEQVPLFNKTIHIDLINDLVAKYNVNIYLPLIDSEIKYTSLIEDELKTTAAVNSYNFCNSAIQKSQYDEMVDGTSIKIPRTLARGEIPTNDKFVVKKDGGFGGRATHILSKNDYDGKNFDTPDWNIYEFIDGEEFTIDCFPLLSSGDAVVSVRKRIEVKSGVSSKVRIMQDEDLKKFAKHLTNKFELKHPFCFQTRKKNNQHFLIDINPRLGGGSSMSALNGTDFHSAHLAKLLGENPLKYLKRLNEKCVVTRQYSDYLMSR